MGPEISIFKLWQNIHNTEIFILTIKLAFLKSDTGNSRGIVTALGTHVLAHTVYLEMYVIRRMLAFILNQPNSARGWVS